MNQIVLLVTDVLAIVLLVFAAWEPRLLPPDRQQVLVVRTAFADERALIAQLEGLVGARVHRVTVQGVDMVNDTTWVDVRFEVDRQPRTTSFDSVGSREALDGQPAYRPAPVQR